MRVSRFGVIALMILAPAFLRALQAEWNLVPIGALALFCGSRFRNRSLAFAIPLISMALGDALLGIKHHNAQFYTFHRLLPVVYSCYAVSVLMGFGLRRHWDRVESQSVLDAGQERSPRSLFFTYVVPISATTLAGSIFFFLVTNFGDWYVYYPHTAAGLLDCYLLGLPYFRGTLLGDVLGSALLFGGDHMLRLSAATQVESERI